MANELIIYGIHPVTEALESGRDIDRVYVRKGADSPAVNRIRQICREDRISFQEVPVEKLNRLTCGNHQGIVAQVSPITYAELTDVMEKIEQESRKALIVVLDGVTDVRNFGALARSAECAGADAIVVSLKNAAPVNAEAIRSSAGALNLIPVCRVGSLRNTLKYLENCGLSLVAATEKGANSLYQADLSTATALVMGAEDTGISKELLKMCNQQVSIPMQGKIGSLNVAAAASVILFEMVRQRTSK